MSRKPKSHCLSDGARDKLIDLLGLDPSVNPDEREKATRAITQVEGILGLYEQHLEDYKSLRVAKAGGRPKKEVLQKAIGELRRTFRQYYGEVDNTRDTRGAVSSLSLAENDEREFIHFALKDADIGHPSLKKIRGSYNKQGTPLADRDKVIEKLEAEAERRAMNSPRAEGIPDQQTILEVFSGLVDSTGRVQMAPYFTVWSRIMSYPLPETGYLRLTQIVGDPDANPPIPALIPIGKSTWWDGVKSGRFPQPVKLGPRTTAWRIEDIRAWIEHPEFNKTSG